MTDTSANNKRIAKNTVILYVRMLLAMAVSLFTSRVVLQTLGVVDYGIYGVVGGIVAMFTFLNSSMAGATSRFLTYELGQGNASRLQETFISAFWLHCIIALVIVLVAETVGLWFLTHKLVIPEDRMSATHWVYQLSILTMVVNVTQVPYNASIIAHEKMSVYAYVEILNVILKLLIVYLLLCLAGDKLILYAVLFLGVTVFTMMLYRLYCLRNFVECKVRFLWNPRIIKPMLKFSGWDIYGNMSVLARTQGVNMLLNMFFGPALNAASSIATQVQSAVMSFANNILTASRPQIMKQYAMGNNDVMVSLIRNTLRLNFLLLMVITIPLLLEIDFVLYVWLGEVPGFAASFCTFTLLFNFFASISSVLVSGIHATGRIKRPSLINGTLYLSVIPVTYILFKGGIAPWSSYLFNVVAVFIGMISNAFTLRMYVCQFPLQRFILEDLGRCLLVFIVVYASCCLLHEVMNEGWLRLITTCLLSTTLLLTIGFLFIVPISLRNRIILLLKEKLCRKD